MYARCMPCVLRYRILGYIMYVRTNIIGYTLYIRYTLYGKRCVLKNVNWEVSL